MDKFYSKVQFLNEYSLICIVIKEVIYVEEIVFI